ncbi:MAG TPA: magnesium chelatase domain-containing protein [Spirochaetota bacterium]|nr:magnesium chelatase domain-containing protein [Spirochaetota bacterium]HOS32086.1 magnesium chelatase domain-containing protein [Spirochaetota bacterium]HOS55427.1 magnesium chelatase domain-containing protein [Spirochaetota bacterium]HPK61821.1 magnesium chelatase domain-containing protein [Spirochaetota bacterium]HQF78013.1 magnesium chelatase domain-containing protein [Spirochaetota bacterium]
MKNSKKYICVECAYATMSWIGKCPQCNSWNTLIEEKQQEKEFISRQEIKLNLLKDIKIDPHEIIKISDNDLNMFFGDGIVCGSVILLSGEPGIGKSTFLFYLADNIESSRKIYYFSGEETLQQLKIRAERLELKKDKFFLSNNNDLTAILELCKKERPDIIFFDSIQTLKHENIENDGSVSSLSQMRICANDIVEFSKSFNIPVIIVGHINKSGEIAGPKIVEHLVDVVLYFEFDARNNYRILRSVKNRFGTIDNILFFDMLAKGLKVVDNNLETLKGKNIYNSVVGKCKTIAVEGIRTFLIEIEALVVPTVFVNPRRYSEGIDVSRVNKIIGVINKYLNENLNNYDIYVNITQGIRIKDVGIDLAIAMAIYSSKINAAIKGDTCFIGEISLTGEILSVKKMFNRVKEAEKYNINKTYLSENIDIENKENCIIIENVRDMKNIFNK